MKIFENIQILYSRSTDTQMTIELSFENNAYYVTFPL
jgi:hypothetical protein